MGSKVRKKVSIGPILRTDSSAHRERVAFVVHEVANVRGGEVGCPFAGRRKDTIGNQKIVCEFCGAVYELTWSHSSSSEGHECQYTHQPTSVKVDFITVVLASPRG